MRGAVGRQHRFLGCGRASKRVMSESTAYHKLGEEASRLKPCSGLTLATNPSGGNLKTQVGQLTRPNKATTADQQLPP